VMQALAEKRVADAEKVATSLHQRRPTELVTYLALGAVAEARGNLAEARRAYGSLLDRFADSARLHRVAAAWLGHLGDKTSRALAADALQFAIRLGDGRVESERQLAWLLAEKGDYGRALELLTAAFLHQENRQPTLLNQEIAVVASALVAKHPEQRDAVMAQLKLSGTGLAMNSELVFTLQDESARGLALSIYADPKHGHRFQGTPYAFSDREQISAYEVSEAERRAPYTLRVVDRGRDRYFRAKCTGLGFVRILDYDGRGRLHVEFRPFVLQQEGAEVDLATYG
jgi:tetratricopeptide (TPR) repeat protein